MPRVVLGAFEGQLKTVLFLSYIAYLTYSLTVFTYELICTYILQLVVAADTVHLTKVCIIIALLLLLLLL